MKKIYTIFLLLFWLLSPVSGQNLIVNPSAEIPPVGNGWIQVNGNWQQRTVSPDPQHGLAYFFAGANSSAEIYQDVDVSVYAPDIDQGAQEFTFMGYTSSWPGAGVDDSRLIVEYQDIGGDILDSYDTGWVQSTTWMEHSDTRLAPVGTRIIRIRILADRDSGNNNDGYADNLSLTAEGALPVEFISFHAAPNEKSISLYWQTATELNNRGFEVQKSFNGIDWETIDFIIGQGTTTETNTYHYEDFNPFSGINYYRLKQVDYDNAFKHSELLAIEYSYLNRFLQIFPNPSKGLINIQFETTIDQQTEIILRNNLGSVVWEKNISGRNSNWRNEIEIEEPGIYFITIHSGKEVQTQKVMIID